jgi:hypothetical protein
MSKSLLVAFAIGIACIAIAVAGIFYMQRGAHVALESKMLKVRSAPLDENSSLVALDFRINNGSDYPFKVRSVTVLMEDAAGGQTEGQTVSEPDAKRVFAGIPLLGQKYNDSLIMNDKLPPKASWDRMIASRFEVPEAKLETRKRFLVRIEEVDGPVVEIPEKK